MNAVQLAPTPKRPSRAQQVVTAVCEYFDLREEVLLAHTRTCKHCERRNGCECGCSPRGRAYTDARTLICHVLAQDLCMAHTRIGLLLDREHATINYYVQKAHLLLPRRSDLRWHLAQVRSILHENGVLRG